MPSAALGTGGGLPPALFLRSPAGRVDPAALLPPFAAVVVGVDPLHVLPAGLYCCQVLLLDSYFCAGVKYFHLTLYSARISEVNR